MKRKPPSAKKRLREHREMVSYSDLWSKRFAAEKNLELLELELKSLDRSTRRVARLESYIRRKTR